MLPTDNSQKLPLAVSLARMAASQAANVAAAIGNGLPCTVLTVDGPGIVTVNFEVETDPYALPQVQMPVSKSPYLTYPIQVGDIGVALSADLRTGAITGLGGGRARVTDTVGTLSAMTFFFLGKKSETFLDAEALELYGNILCTPTELSFFAGAKTTKQSISPEATDLGSVITLANSIRTALIAYGLVS